VESLASTVVAMPVTIAQSRRGAILSLPQTPPTWGRGMCGFTKVRHGDKVGGERAGCKLDSWDAPMYLHRKDARGGGLPSGSNHIMPTLSAAFVFRD
jgi:hypothetical protein